MNIIFASYGNDSIALIQWAINASMENLHTAYSDTGWAADWWLERVNQAESWCKENGIITHRIISEGMRNLVRRKKAFPRGGGGRFQFCTQALKQKPALEWLDEVDPNNSAICLLGIRREESRNRANFPVWTSSSNDHGGRMRFAPLATYLSSQRDALIKLTPFEVLPHRSRECFPCVNCNKQELKLLDEDCIRGIENFEKEMGVNSKGNPRVLFSPKRHNGAIGIREVVEDAKHNMDDLLVMGCDGGWCGS